MNFKPIEEAKKFYTAQMLSKFIYNVHEKQLSKELRLLDDKTRCLTNFELVKTPLNNTFIHIKGCIEFNANERIPIRSLDSLGYKTGGICDIKITYFFKQHDVHTTRLFGKTSNILTGYITFIEPISTRSDYCDRLNLIATIPFSNDNDINHAVYCFSNTPQIKCILLKCKLQYNIPFNSRDKAVEQLNKLYETKHGTPLLYEFMKGFYTDVELDENNNSFAIHHYGIRDIQQSQLISAICSDTLLVTATGAAGTGKTHCIITAVLNGIHHGKTFLIVCPNNKSCDSLLDTLFKWEPYLLPVLLLRSDSDLVTHPDKYDRSERYYFEELLYNFIDTMDDTDKEIVLKYKEYKSSYDTLRERAPTTYTREYLYNLDFSLRQLSIVESMLPGLVMRYCRPKLLVTTTNYILNDIKQEYTTPGIDTIIFEDASQITTSIALLILSKFPNSNVRYLGDWNQLPPPELYDPTLNDYEKTVSMPILKWMNNNKFTHKFELENNHRSHPQIVNFLSTLFYNNSLDAMTLENDYNFENIIFKNVYDSQTEQTSKIHPYYFFNIPHMSNQSTRTSSHDVKEATSIAILLLYLKTAGIEKNRIAIMCLHDAQVRTIQSELDNFLTNYASHLFIEVHANTIQEDLIIQDLRNFSSIGTPDSFQGQDFDYVIISTSTSKETSSEILKEFYELKIRICNSISKAKLGFFILGDCDTLKVNPYWMNIISYMKSKDTIRPFQMSSLREIFHRRLRFDDYFNYFF
uniref:AAA_12 domain-containing protein n=1 Tax=Strongyloides papillosus TaxID=174720 RepID=A0A0N5B4M1_STREA